MSRESMSMFLHEPDPMAPEQEVALREKLAELRTLQAQYRITGISFAVREGETITTEASVDYVLEVIRQTADLLARTDKIPNLGYCPPK